MTILKVLLLPSMSAVIVLSFILPPPLGGVTWAEASRIFYYHVPQAIVAFIAFATAMVYGVIYLARRDMHADGKAALAAELGTVFCILAAITGSIFARVAWGAFWHWDPRETSILILLIIYGAYFAIRQSVAQPERRAAFSAAYLILAFVAVPFFGLVWPRIHESLHPGDTLISGGTINIGGHVALVFFGALFCFLFVYLWLFGIGSRILRLELHRMEESCDI